MRTPSPSVLTMMLIVTPALTLCAFEPEPQLRSAGQKAPRTIYRAGPIPQRLQPGDTDVTVISGEWRGLSVGPGGKGGKVAACLDLGATAVIVDLQQGTARLTADQDFVETEWHATVLELLRLGPSHPFGGQRKITFTTETGDLKIGSTTIHARLGWARPMVPGKYLIFVYWDKDRSLPKVSPGDTYRMLDDGTLERIDLMQNEISKLTSRDAIAQVKEWVKQKGGAPVP